MKQVKKQQRTLTAEDMKTQNVSHCIFYFFHKFKYFSTTSANTKVIIMPILQT